MGKSNEKGGVITLNFFNIDASEFGIGDIQLSIENNRINLEIAGDEKNFDELVEDSKWSWALYPPRIYFRDVPYEGRGIEVIEVNFDLSDQCDIGLYMMEHNDFTGTLKIEDKSVCISGQVNMMGRVLPVSICADRRL